MSNSGKECTLTPAEDIIAKMTVFPYSIRMAIYRYLLPHYNARVDVSPDPFSDSNECVFGYDSLAKVRNATDSLRGKRMIAVKRDIVDNIHLLPFVCYTEIQGSDDGCSSGDCDAGCDAICTPEDRRSPYHRAPGWYAKTWSGLVLATLVECLQYGGATDFASVSVAKCMDDAINVAIVRVRSMTLPFGDGVSGYRLEDTMRACVRQGVAQLSSSKLVHLHLTMPSFRAAHWPYTYAIIHDLRYIADNGYATVRVFVRVNEFGGREEWRTWLNAVRGQVDFVL